jgi:hypothetical protein
MKMCGLSAWAQQDAGKEMTRKPLTRLGPSTTTSRIDWNAARSGQGDPPYVIYAVGGQRSSPAPRPTARLRRRLRLPNRCSTERR